MERTLNQSIDTILQAKRAGKALSSAQIDRFVAGVVDGSVSRAQAAAWLAFAFTRGLNDHEAVALTRAMTASGTVLSWPRGSRIIDKHSTGGVGDKVSLVLAPLWAELGYRVPMISGRGLGHTGGTLDKLESIPGFRTDLDDAALGRMLDDVGCFMNGQTSALAPADRILYALRNETQTVECIPLIVASILSKKLAEGLDDLVLDVKCGSGAFMKSREDARALAVALCRVGNGAGVRTSATLTDMEQPLGVAVGNGPEVEESIACLQGGGPASLRELTVKLARDPRAAAVLASGAAYERFARMVHGHGGDLSAFSLTGVKEHVLVAPRGGWLARCDALAVGLAVFRLGAGRLRAEDPVDPAVGARVWHRIGDRVEAGEPLLTLLYRDGRLDAARAELNDAFEVADSPVAARPICLEEVE